MTPAQMQLMASGLLESVKDHVARAIAKVPSGKSAYQIAVERGFPGTELQWLDSLRGERGAQGEAGRGEKGDKGDRGDNGVGFKGDPGEKGDPGKDAVLDEEKLWGRVRAGIDAILESWPIPKDGEKGDPGKDAVLDEGKLWLRVQNYIDAFFDSATFLELIPKPKAGEKGATGDKGDQGEAGEDGVSVDIEDVQPLINSELARLVAELPRAKDGEPGKPGKDGESVHPDTLARLIDEAVERALAKRPAPRDGEPGRDAAQIEPLQAVDSERSYARGTYADWRCGMIRAVRQTDPLKPTMDLVKAGWVVCMNGLFSDATEPEDGGRYLVRKVVFTDGTERISRIKTAIAVHRGLWTSEREYDRGDLVTADGSIFHSEADKPKGMPGSTPDWRLVVKRGSHGKDLRDPEPVKKLATPRSK